jgi:putative hydrolase of the HAD superfamily
METAFKFIVSDLDDTIYPRDSRLMQEVGRRIQLWLCNHLGLAWEEAITMRCDYFARYGTTLGGLIALHDVDIHEYLEFVHDVPVDEYLDPDPALATMLDGIPLRKAIYTNGTSAHGWRVLQALQVSDRFEQVIGIEEVGLRNKVNPDAYEHMLALLGAQGPECIMIEDTVNNLRPAKTLGLTTILVSADGSAESPGEDVDFRVESILEVGRIVNGLLRR